VAVLPDTLEIFISNVMSLREEHDVEKLQKQIQQTESGDYLVSPDAWRIFKEEHQDINVYMDVIFLLRFLCYHEPQSISFVVCGQRHERVYYPYFTKYGIRNLHSDLGQSSSPCDGFACVSPHVLSNFNKQLLAMTMEK